MVKRSASYGYSETVALRCFEHTKNKWGRINPHFCNFIALDDRYTETLLGVYAERHLSGSVSLFQSSWPIPIHLPLRPLRARRTPIAAPNPIPTPKETPSALNGRCLI